jgi:PAS domain S-box-containing protein
MGFVEMQRVRSVITAALSVGLLAPVAVGHLRASSPQTIRVVTDNDYVPYSFRASDGQLQGIIVDQWAAWRQKTGITADVRAMDLATALSRMRAGDFDVIDSIVETPERQREFDFTSPYATVEAAIFFRDTISGITDVASLKGFPVGVKIGDQHIDKLLGHDVAVMVPFHNYRQMIDAAREHKIDVFVADTPAAIYLLTSAGIASEFRRSAPIFRDKLRRAVRKGDLRTLQEVSAGFEEIAPDELKAIDEKWFGSRLTVYRQVAGYAGWTGAAALLLMAILFGWNRMLSRRVFQRTAALRDSEERFRQIAENIQEVFWLFATDTKNVLYVSPAYEEVAGRPPDGLYRTSRTYFGLIHPDDRRCVADAFRRDRERGFDIEYRLLRPDGSIRSIRNRAFPIRDRAGRVYRLAGIAEDVTERRRAADALKRAEDRVRLIIDTIPAMVWSLHPDGSMSFVNRRWLEYTGRSIEEALVRPEATIHPDDAGRAVQKWLRDIVDGQPAEDELRLRRHDGEYRWFLIRTMPFCDEHGAIVEWYGTSTDIEDRKRAEEKLMRSEMHLAEAQRIAHVGSWEWDLRTLQGAWSDECYRIFGVADHNVDFYQETMRLIHPEDRDRIVKTSQAAIRLREPYEFYFRIVRADGTERVLHSMARVVRNGNGEPIQLRGATQDVTELKSAEEGLRTTTDQLRALSARLQSAREEERTRIAREIHDELGATLTSLRWEVERIRKKLPGREAAADWDGNVAAALGLIDTAIAEVRRIASDLRPVVLDVLGVEEAIEWQAQQFQDRTGIPVHCASDGSGAELNSEQATALFRIFQEALTNTLRHSAATRVDVTMEGEPGKYVLTVRDNGKGITDEEKMRQSSVGILGMRERAGLIGGEVHVAGVGGQGTTVTVWLPLPHD